jgi:hypothetical protein
LDNAIRQATDEASAVGRVVQLESAHVRRADAGCASLIRGGRSGSIAGIDGR